MLLILKRRNKTEKKGGYKTTRICTDVHLKLRWDTQGKACFLQTANKCEKQFHNSPMDGMGWFCCLLSFPHVVSHKATFGDSQRSRISSNNGSYMAIYTLEVFNPKMSYLHSVFLGKVFCLFYQQPAVKLHIFNQQSAKSVSFSCVHRENIINCITNL